MQYRLAEGLACCVADGRPILLDLPGDRYVVPPMEGLAAFERMLRGELLSPVDVASLSGMVRRGYLVPVGCNQRWAFEPVTVQTASTDYAADTRRPHAILLLSSILCLLWAAAKLRFSGLDRTLIALERRKCRRAWTLSGKFAAKDVARAFAAIALWWSSHDRCLVRSIAMKRLLDILAIQGDLLIGVTGRPFAAHCWVQKDTCVLNDDVSRVGLFTPIYQQ